METMKWTRSETRTGRVVYTSGAYRIERREYTLPTRSTAYTLWLGEIRCGQYDTLSEAKESAREDVEAAADKA